MDHVLPTRGLTGNRYYTTLGEMKPEASSGSCFSLLLFCLYTRVKHPAPSRSQVFCITKQEMKLYCMLTRNIEIDVAILSGAFYYIFEIDRSHDSLVWIHP